MKKLNEEIQRIRQIMNRINEQAFNDVGEPMMSHKQYQDYSEPSEPDDTVKGEYIRDIEITDIIKEFESHFNTILQCYGNEFFVFTTPDFDGDDEMMIWTRDNKIGARRADGEVFQEQDIDELDVYELIEFFEPYKEQILNTKDAIKQIEKDRLNSSYDYQYSKQEQSFTSGGG
jgi:hypothetical protein